MFNKIGGIIYKKAAEIKSEVSKIAGPILSKAGKRLIKIKDDPAARKKFILNYVSPSVMVLTLIVTVSYWSNANFGLTVKYDGETMATIENEAVLEKANELLNSRLAVPAEDAASSFTYEITSVSSEQAKTSPLAVYSKIISMNGNLSDDAVGLFVDGNFIGASTEPEKIKKLIGDNLEAAKFSEGAYDAKYCNEIQYSTGIYPADSVFSADQLYSKVSDVLNIALINRSSEDQEIPYSIVYNETSDQYEGYSECTQDGENGIQTVTTQYTLLNGELIETETVDTTIIKEPVDQIITVGTKPLPPKGVGSGVLAWPTTMSDISSYYGQRWGKLHKGIDISFSGCYGSDILASDGGVVSFSGYDDGGYGYCVIIDHGNGMQTRYAHCSELYVSSGEPVGKGQTIAAIGSSGNSDGAHLHFEVIVNGSVTDPLNYF